MACQATLSVDADWLWMISDSKLLLQLVGGAFLSLLVVVVIVLIVLVLGLFDSRWLIQYEHKAQQISQ